MDERNPMDRPDQPDSAIATPPSVTPDKPDRIVAFSDGVFAIAITLLALDLIPSQLPKTTNVWQLASGRTDQVICFVISFWVIGLYWMAHVRMFRWIERADTKLFMLNLASLMLVTFMPYPTAVLSEFSQQTSTVVFYALTAAAAGMMQTVMWIYASSGYRLIRADTPPAFVRLFTLRGVLVAAIFVLSCGIALYSATLATLAWIAIPFVLAIARRAAVHSVAQTSSQR